MKKIFNLLLCFFPFITLQAQINEIGVFLGGSNYVGDVGSTTYIAPEKLAFGILYKWNKSPRHSYRFSYTQSKISANDLDSKETSRNRRGFRFDNDIKELSAGLEFNFFDFNLHDEKPKITPYIYSGLSVFRYNELYITSGQTKIDQKSTSLAIPITLGIKSNISRDFVLGLEVGARYTFTDNLDGSNPKNDFMAGNRFGNLNNNDWYVFSGLTLTYTFGEKPCYCAE
ncbi:DUF6089 family protein [Flavobacterium sp. Fl-77]|uniref:DUF6089 family protein n=1 Tax=Flavobacterium flavipigmentatum TaxID=2893884 RepID=A0AAJ2SJA8_9FLAO|nr:MULTISPECIES: DUF6089 family protein [unclassified Flavobacterium]MDX6183570.1 DUF6089 family protein [Flavobacterium sp. Fl-33]MDX6187028.1 DUF6089 family protein [Flavobacterium sp. Fl-77]UFH40240.1 DUF6089 family protein [Flavobacterium sp. F-70]